MRFARCVAASARRREERARRVRERARTISAARTFADNHKHEEPNHHRPDRELAPLRLLLAAAAREEESARAAIEQSSVSPAPRASMRGAPHAPHGRRPLPLNPSPRRTFSSSSMSPLLCMFEANFSALAAWYRFDTTILPSSPAPPRPRPPALCVRRQHKQLLSLNRVRERANVFFPSRPRARPPSLPPSLPLFPHSLSLSLPERERE